MATLKHGGMITSRDDGEEKEDEEGDGLIEQW